MRRACRIAQRANSFKLVELAQLCWACKEMKFRNARLMDAIATGIAAAPRREINPASVTNLLSYISSLEYMNPTTMDQLVRRRCLLSTCASQLATFRGLHICSQTSSAML